jgi:uncharacterized protein YndB with AHSA1/START domain
MKTLILLFLFPLSVLAEVVDSSANGFTISIEREVKVNQQAAYQQFTNIEQWWIADHTYFGKSENLSLDLKAGGCFCEIEGDKQVLHMTISFVDPGNEVRMIGGLGPLQMMGVSGGMSWTFKPLENGNTKISHRYQVSGSVKGGLDKLAEIVNKVQTMQVDSLVKKFSNQ